MSESIFDWLFDDLFSFESLVFIGKFHVLTNFDVWGLDHFSGERSSFLAKFLRKSQ